MTVYAAPLRDMRFLLHEVLGADRLAELPGYADATPDIFDAVLEEAADPAFGGQGLPKALKLAVDEMACSANISFAIYPGLSTGAYNLLSRHGSDTLKALYLPRLVDGSWSGTMCLTEPQCGTDLGLIRTRAVPQDDGSYCITGTKIFISAGEHDLTSNIVHLVLARLPDAPAGVRGISLFLVPKFLPDADGRPAERNGARCAGIERKMGVHASSTCVMAFEDATGWLVGEAHKGLRAMFTMMNDARLEVGIQGLGLAETAYQSAVAYARERLQGRALAGPKYPEQPADPILVHPDVRRMLLTMRATNEGCRALAYWIGVTLDSAEKHPDPETRAEADDLVALMTPIIKAFFTEQGFLNASTGVQVMGGHGYVREWGMEQLVRDARIAMLYEGANGIQALDLVGRKLRQDYGRLLRRFFHPVADYIDARVTDPAMAPLVGALGKSLARLQQATLEVARKGLADPDEAGAASDDYLRLFALTALAFMWCRMAETAGAKLTEGASGDAAFYEAKLKTARFYMERVLPEATACFARAMSGAATVMDFDDVAF
jgi:alkylation response protein AidB-like acyl-CoA dehydrogenase